MNHNLLLTIAKYSVWEAVRDKFLFFILMGGVLFFCISLFIGELAITEATEIQAALLASALRLFSVFTMSLFVITSMVREFNDKGFELILSHPVPRSSYYFGKFSGFSVVAIIISSMSVCCLFLYAPAIPVLFWSFSLFCELLIIIALSLLALFSFNSITISFSVVMAFYLLARSIEVIQLISDSPILESSSMSHEFINSLLDLIAYVIPDLYKFTKTDWLVYSTNINDSVFIIIGQTAVYVVLLSCVALFDLYRKEL
ncbi:MAG TPA: ABC transporter permease [Thiotrichaceae bacterium]|jgi:ABC-type transport system involved in multi-copper enzyme maturation permease subunit|nr:ABC transporter permease [Thiotrichaceae bacterium]HIM08843.1 ABC transporter permease [Gammaproteobacteria bacterium]